MHWSYGLKTLKHIISELSTCTKKRLEQNGMNKGLGLKLDLNWVDLKIPPLKNKENWHDENPERNGLFYVKSR